MPARRESSARARTAAWSRLPRPSRPRCAPSSASATAQDGDVPFAQLAAHEAPRSLRATAIDLAALIYTSGSTGKPKGVTLTHQNMTFAAASLAEYLEMQQDEVVLLCLPLSFDYGLYQLLLTVLVGGDARAREGLRLPGHGRRAARERGRHRPAGRADAVRRAARPARPRRPRAARAALPLQHGRRALGDDDRRPARDVPAGAHLLHVRPHRVQARVATCRRT